MIELRPYQVEAVNRVRQSITEGHKRPLLVLSTGAGKSCIYGQIISLACSKGKTCLFTVHRRNLVNQFADTLRQHFGIEAGIIMAGVDFEPGKQVYLSTIQTYSRRVKLTGAAFAKYFIDADIVLTDESHTSISKRYKDVLSMYRDKIIIGTTATPARADGCGLGGIYDDLIEVINASELTSKGFLAPVRYFAPSFVDLSKIKVKMGDYDKQALGRKMDKPKLIGDVVESWLKLAENRKTIVFAVNVKHSIHLRDEFLKNGVNAAHLDARSTDEERTQIIDSLENGDVDVICNVGLFVEGLDIQKISCVCMAHPTKSLGKYRQCVGRGLRIYPGKEDLILLDFGGVIEEHGFITDEIEWTLDGKEKAWKRPKERDHKEKIVTCRSCEEIFQGVKKCPRCGTEVKTFGRAVVAADGELEEIKAIKKATVADKRRYLGMLKYWVNDKGYNPRMINAKYKTRYNCWPHHSVKDVSPIAPDQAFLNLMRHDMIKYAKSKKNA